MHSELGTWNLNVPRLGMSCVFFLATEDTPRSTGRNIRDGDNATLGDLHPKLRQSWILSEFLCRALAFLSYLSLLCTCVCACVTVCVCNTPDGSGGERTALGVGCLLPLWFLGSVEQAFSPEVLKGVSTWLLLWRLFTCLLRTENSFLSEGDEIDMNTLFLKIYLFI